MPEKQKKQKGGGVGRDVSLEEKTKPKYVIAFLERNSQKEEAWVAFATLGLFSLQISSQLRPGLRELASLHMHRTSQKVAGLFLA